MPPEEWRDAPFASRPTTRCPPLVTFGTRERADVLRPWIAGHGYYDVQLGRRNRRTEFHALVAEAFCGPKPTPLHEVAHWDGMPTNNRADNLRWATHAENIEDQRRHGTLYMINGSGMRGDLHPRAKLSGRDVLDIRHLYNGRRGQLQELAASYGVNRSTIKRAAVGLMWSHI